jgi:ABC-2 type transport system permease protein
MITLVRQELFKLLHKKSTWILAVIQLVIMIGSAVFVKTKSGLFNVETAFLDGFGGLAWGVFVLIAASAAIITMEFQYGTIKELLYRRYYRGQILVSKWLTILIYGLGYYILTFLVSLLLKVILFNSTFKLSAIYINHLSYLKVMFLTFTGSFLTLWLLLSLVFLLANIFKNSTAAIIVAVICYFATSIISNIMFLLMQKWEWLKWNPFNMMNLTTQLIEPQLKTLTMVSTQQMVIGNFVYLAIFLGLGYVVFQRRNI